MLLQFNHMDELNQFMEWAGYTKKGQAITAIGPGPESLHGFAASVPMENGPDRLVPEPVTGEAQSTDAAQAPTPRKRRTKAEIEAERAAAAVAPDNADTTSTEKPQMTAQEAIAQALATAELRKKRAEQTAEPVQAASIPDVPEASSLSPLDPALMPSDFIARRGAEISELPAIEHLNAARNFIAKHGMPKYNESFSLCGLSPNVLQFSPQDCALHAAALEWLDAN